MPSLDPELAEAYTELEKAIEKVLRLRDANGVLVEWATICSVQRIDDEGDTVGSVLRVLPMGGGVPYHRIMGLLEYAQTVMRAEVARNELEVYDDGDDDAG